MDNERILLAEGHDRLRAAEKELLENQGHTVVADTGSLRAVRRIVDDTAIEFRVAIVSGHLPETGDGEKAAAYIKAQRPEVIVISHATPKQTFGNFNVYKGDAPEVLLDTIKKA